MVAAGRNQPALNRLRDLGADATISLALPESELINAFAREAGQSGFQIVIDYVWGRPAEAFLAAITRRDFTVVQSETRLVQVGESAGPSITLPAAVLRSTALTISGTAGIPPLQVLREAFQRVMAHVAKGELHVDTEPVPLAEVERAWERDCPGYRLVMMTPQQI